MGGFAGGEGFSGQKRRGDVEIGGEVAAGVNEARIWVKELLGERSVSLWKARSLRVVSFDLGLYRDAVDFAFKAADCSRYCQEERSPSSLETHGQEDRVQNTDVQVSYRTV